MAFEEKQLVRQVRKVYPTREGMIGIVTKVYEDYLYYRYDVIYSDSNDPWPYAEEDLELVK